MAPNLTGISIIIPSVEHKNGILEIIRNVMLEHEPVEKALGFSWDECRESWEKGVDDWIAAKNSHIAINDKGEVIGARLSRVFDLSTLSPDYGLYDWQKGPNEKSRVIVSLFNELTRNWYDVFIKENGQRCQKLLQFTTLAVKPEYGNRGIGVAMTNENLAVAKSNGCDFVTVVATNWMSQKVFEKCGLRTVGETFYSDFRDEEGRPKVNVVDSKNPCVKWMVKEL